MKLVPALDLLQNNQHVKYHCSVVVVGAGAAGIYLATSLASKGIDVVLLEAGGQLSMQTSAIGFEPVFSDAIYRGATEGRFFGIGGSTAQWGGLLVPHTTNDCDDHLEHPSTWRHVVRVVAQRTPAVLTRLGWHGAPHFAEYARFSLRRTANVLAAGGYEPMAGLFLPHRRKNFSNLLAAMPRGSIRVVLNAVATQLRVTEGTSGCRVGTVLEAVSAKGSKLEVAAQQFVICAGAIETTRFLLDFDDRTKNPLAGRMLGYTLGDHLSVPIATVAPLSKRLATKLFAPRFSAGWMRTFRFLEQQRPVGARRGFLHFIFAIDDPGFQLARSTLTALQAGRFPDLTLRKVASGLLGLSALAYARLIRGRLHVPSPTDIRLQLDIEQIPDCRNRIRLTPEIDSYGRRIATIDWAIRTDDLHAVQTTASRILSHWNRINALPLLVSRQLDWNVSKPYDAYHPVGTCRMGDDDKAVVSFDCRVHNTLNLFALSTAVFPSAGTANPTFSLLCLADALVDTLSDETR